MVRPLLEYGNLVCSPYLKGDIEKAVQPEATRIIPALEELPDGISRKAEDPYVAIA